MTAVTPAKKPASRKPAAKPLLVAGPDVVKTKAPASRPVLLESEVFRNEIARRGQEVSGAIDIIDATELQAEADFNAAVLVLTNSREAERAAQAQRKSDLTRILNGCRAAMDASDAPAAA